MSVLLSDHTECRSLLLLGRLSSRDTRGQVDDHHVCGCKKTETNTTFISSHSPSLRRVTFLICSVFLTGGLFAETAGVPEQLEGLLEARCVLCGSIRCLDVGDEGAHLPLGLTGGWREKTLIALVQRTGANRLCHGQDGDLEE